MGLPVDLVPWGHFAGTLQSPPARGSQDRLLWAHLMMGRMEGGPSNQVAGATHLLYTPYIHQSLVHSKGNKARSPCVPETSNSGWHNKSRDLDMSEEQLPGLGTPGRPSQEGSRSGLSEDAGGLGPNREGGRPSASKRHYGRGRGTVLTRLTSLSWAHTVSSDISPWSLLPADVSPKVFLCRMVRS